MWFGPNTVGVPDPPTEPPEARRSCGGCKFLSYSPDDTGWGVCTRKTIESYEAGGKEDFVEWEHVDDGFDCDEWEEE